MKSKSITPWHEDIDIQLILDSTPGYVFWKDLNSVYKWCNKNGLELYGAKSIEDFAGKTDYDFNQKLAKQFVENDQYVIRTGQVHVTESDIVTTPTGQQLILKTEKKPLYDRNGQIIGVLGISLDITAQKKNERLAIENEVNKTLILQQEKFRKIVDQVAHDIRSPLVSMMMLVNVCEDIPEKQRVLLRTAAGRITDIANNLLNIYSQEKATSNSNGSLEERESILVSPAVLEILSEKKYQYQNLPVKFDHHFSQAGNFCWIHASPSAFKRMLSNIINNAVDAFDQKEGKVTLHLDADEEQVRITVEDNGKGMRPELAQKIMNQVAVTEGKKEGHGIGLTQVHDTLKSNEGKMEIESIIGMGTQIILTFPRVVAQNWIADSIQLYDDDTVVVLDDDRSIHSAWDFRFETLQKAHPNLNVIHHHKGQDTYDYFNQLSPGQKQKVFLLSDYELPQQGMDGLEVIARTGASRSVLVTSYYGQLAIQQEAGKTGTRMLPKQLAAEVPILVEKRISVDATNQADESAPSKYADIVFVDDSESLLASIRIAFSKKNIATYQDPLDFMSEILHYPKNTKIAIDYNFDNFNQTGLEIAKRLHALGFTRIYLLSGWDFRNELRIPSHLKVIMKNDIEQIKSLIYE